MRNRASLSLKTAFSRSGAARARFARREASRRCWARWPRHSAAPDSGPLPTMATWLSIGSHVRKDPPRFETWAVDGRRRSWPDGMRSNCPLAHGCHIRSTLIFCAKLITASTAKLSPISAMPLTWARTDHVGRDERGRRSTKSGWAPSGTSSNNDRINPPRVERRARRR